MRSAQTLQQTSPKPRGLVRPELNKALCLICGVGSECLQALSMLLLCPFACAELECFILYRRALVSRMIGNTQTLTHRHTSCTYTLSDHGKHKTKKEEDREGRERPSIYGDILLLMSAPPLGSISLTFMLDHTISLSCSLSLSLTFSFPPSS